MQARVSEPSSLGGDSKIGDSLKAWWTDDPRVPLDMVQRRAFDGKGLTEPCVKDYLLRRRSLPFVILGGGDGAPHPPGFERRQMTKDDPRERAPSAFADPHG
ncbi:MAG: hypothetical protein JRM82_01850 [Nitrososphaerota archaeon]|nr:hypothetical protein [Nitrososphaerota archaeon]